MSAVKNVFIVKNTRLVDVFIKSDEDHDFYFDAETGAIFYVDLTSDEDKLEELYNFLLKFPKRLFLFPKMTEYERRKIVEAFLHGKVNDLDVSEKVSRELDFLGYESKVIDILKEYGTEIEKWTAFFSEKMRVMSIEWLNKVIKMNDVKPFSYVFEEDIIQYMDRDKIVAFKESMGSKNENISSIREDLIEFSKIYFEHEIIDPKPKRGRPPKGKKNSSSEIIPIPDMYLAYDSVLRGFIYYDINLNDIASNPFDLADGVFVKSTDRALEQAIASAKVDFLT